MACSVRSHDHCGSDVSASLSSSSASCLSRDMGNQLIAVSSKLRSLRRRGQAKELTPENKQTCEEAVLVEEMPENEKKLSLCAEEAVFPQSGELKDDNLPRSLLQQDTASTSLTLENTNFESREEEENEPCADQGPLLPCAATHKSTAVRRSSLPNLSALADPEVAPPLPPKRKGLPAPVRVHRSESAAGVSLVQERKAPRIEPVRKLGIQQTHTHYFLLAPKCGTDYVNLPQRTDEVVEKDEVLQGLYDNSGFAYSEDSTTKARSARFSLTELGNCQKQSLHRKLSEGTSEALTRSSTMRQSVSQTQLATERRSCRPSSVHLPVHDRFASVVRDDKVKAVLAEVHGSTKEECVAVLAANAWHIPQAIKSLKVEQLFRLGRLSKEQCRHLLNTHNWNLEEAAADLLGAAPVVEPV